MLMTKHKAISHVPAICTSLVLIVFTRLINSMSLEPKSRSIACFTVGDVPKGPGVNNFLSAIQQSMSSIIQSLQTPSNKSKLTKHFCISFRQRKSKLSEYVHVMVIYWLLVQKLDYWLAVGSYLTNIYLLKSESINTSHC